MFSLIVMVLIMVAIGVGIGVGLCGGENGCDSGSSSGGYSGGNSRPGGWNYTKNRFLKLFWNFSNKNYSITSLVEPDSHIRRISIWTIKFFLAQLLQQLETIRLTSFRLTTLSWLGRGTILMNGLESINIEDFRVYKSLCHVEFY